MYFLSKKKEGIRLTKENFYLKLSPTLSLNDPFMIFQKFKFYLCVELLFLLILSLLPQKFPTSYWDNILGSMSKNVLWQNLRSRDVPVWFWLIY